MSSYHRKIPLKEDCPMEVTLNVLSGKWKPAIISSLFRGTKRPRDFSVELPEATRRVLSQQLRELEEDGIIAKKVFEVVPPKVEYFLTDLGRTLAPVISALSSWGEAYDKSRQAS
ncbi:winged helix-turn-helix transcriptional regulator [Pontibacter toksunensis]|uniref:Winged helix-turn-helix transcriptional regulator n=1 Tax=Pontibacter toksunensis TaxID=1332631 RepID=A0ABW6BZQ5_9BACT